MKWAKRGIVVILCMSLGISSSYAERWIGFGARQPVSTYPSFTTQAFSVPANTFPRGSVTHHAAVTVNRGIMRERPYGPRAGSTSGIFTLVFAGAFIGGFIIFFLYGHFTYGDKLENWWIWSMQEYYWGTGLGLPLTAGFIVSAVAAIWEYLTRFDLEAYDRNPRHRLNDDLTLMHQSHTTRVLSSAAKAPLPDKTRDTYNWMEVNRAAGDIIETLVEMGLADEHALVVMDKIFGSVPHALGVYADANRDEQGGGIVDYSIETTDGPSTHALRQLRDELVRMSESSGMKSLSPIQQKVTVWIQEARLIQNPADVKAVWGKHWTLRRHWGKYESISNEKVSEHWLDLSPFHKWRNVDTMARRLIGLGLSYKQALFATDKILNAAPKERYVHVYSGTKPKDKRRYPAFAIYNYPAPLWLENVMNELKTMQRYTDVNSNTSSPLRRNIFAWIEGARMAVPTKVPRAGGPNDEHGIRTAV